MEYGAIDLHKKESQIRIVTESGETLDRRIATTRDRFTAVFEGRRPMRILLEAIESEWVAQHLETLGHEVIVADPTFAPMYSGRSRRIKTESARRRRVGGGVSPGMLSRGASAIGVAAHGAGAPQRPPRTDGQRDSRDLPGAGRSRAEPGSVFGAAAPGASSSGWRRWTSRRRSPRRSRRCGA
jgi:hypothetical protein